MFTFAKAKVRKNFLLTKNMNQNNELTPSSAVAPRVVIRVGLDTMSFLLPHEDGKVEYSPYSVRNGVSMAANLRQAFREAEIIAGCSDRVLLSVASPVALVPIDEYMDSDGFDIDLVYNSTFLGYEHEARVANVIPELNCVAVFSVNKDLKMVVEDRFKDVRIQNVMQPVWSHLYKSSQLIDQRRKLYGYFHDRHIDIFSFQQRRFRFQNTFDATRAHDALYYILFVWKQLAFDNEEDELHLVGSTEHMEWLLTKLKTYVRRVYTINPSADLNRAPASLIEGIDYDMMI